MKVTVPLPARMPVYQGANINFLRMRPRVATVYGNQTPPADAEFVDFVSILRPRQMLDLINLYQNPDYVWDNTGRTGAPTESFVESSYTLWMMTFRRRSSSSGNPFYWQLHFQRGSNTSTHRLTVGLTDAEMPVYARPIVIDTREWVVDEVEVFRMGQFPGNNAIAGCFCYWYASSHGDIFANPRGTTGIQSTSGLDSTIVSGTMGWCYGVHFGQSPSYTTAYVRHLIGNYQEGSNFQRTLLHEAFFPYIPSYVSYGSDGSFETGGFGVSFPFLYPAPPLTTGDATTRIILAPYFTIRNPAQTNNILEPEPMVVIKAKCRRNQIS